jgi:hypothetical protein
MKMILKYAILIWLVFGFSVSRAGDIATTDGSNWVNPEAEEIRKACTEAYAARVAITTLYGSCTASDTSKGWGAPADSMCQSEPYHRVKWTLKQIFHMQSECPKPPTEPEYSQEPPRCRITDTTVDYPNAKTDCSGFVSGVEARLGHRFEQGQDIRGPTTTAQLVDLIGQPKSCWEPVKGNLMPGDMVVYNDGEKGHVYKIDRISQGGPGSCEFSIIESSGGSDEDFGGPRVVVKGGEKGGAAVSDTKGRNWLGMSQDCVAKSGKDVKVARFNDKKPGCLGTPKKFKNEECIQSKCDNLGTHNDI